MSALLGSLSSWLGSVFAAAVVAQTAVRLWLAGRQMAAVSAHRDEVPEMFRGQISPQYQRKAADYTGARVRLGRIATVYEALLKLALTLGGGLAAVDAWVARTGLPAPWSGLALVAAVFLLLQVAGLPFALWRTFGVEARFGFNRVTPRLFAADLAKELALAALLGIPLLLATLTLMQRAGPWWWAIAWLIWLGVTFALTWAAPRYLAPLFNRFSPLADDALERRVAGLLERCGFALDGGVFVMDGSRRSAHGNAYFTGIGRHKRIVLFDTLLARIEPEEIEAVLAHELGHFRLKHIRHHLMLSIAAMGAGLALLAGLAAQPGFYTSLGVPRASNGAALVLFALIVPVFGYFLKPLRAWWLRRHEFEADDFAAAHADPAKLSAALVKLYRDNATALTPDPIHSAFYDSHPPAPVRIARLNALAAGRG